MLTTPLAFLRLAVPMTAILLLAACAAEGGPTWTYAPLGPTPAATGTPAGTPATTPGTSPGETPGETVIEIEETADLRILRDGQPVHELRLAVGETYLFRVTNTAGFVHDFFLGPGDRLQAGDTDGLPGVPEFTEGTEEFSWTATADAEGWEFACTVLGHYGPMHGQIILEGN